jgi:uncharacterized repeat protein (TIGR01451 family)
MVSVPQSQLSWDTSDFSLTWDDNAVAYGQLNALAGNSGGGLRGDVAAVYTIKNTIIADNNGGDCIGSGTFTTLGHNIDSDDTCSLTHANDKPGVDPVLGPLGDNGGLTLTHAVLGGSPALNAGDDSAAPVTDQRGVTRPQGAASDIGAFERSLADITVTTEIADLSVTLAVASLSVTNSDPLDPAAAPINVSHTVTVVNNGPDEATGVALADTLPAGVAFVSAGPTQMACSHRGSVVTCKVGTIAKGGSNGEYSRRPGPLDYRYDLQRGQRDRQPGRPQLAQQQRHGHDRRETTPQIDADCCARPGRLGSDWPRSYLGCAAYGGRPVSADAEHPQGNRIIELAKQVSFRCQ